MSSENISDIEILYSPSRWSKRYESSEECMIDHVRIITEGKKVEEFIILFIQDSSFQKVRSFVLMYQEIWKFRTENCQKKNMICLA